MVIHAFKELKTYIALNARVFLKPLEFISCGSSPLELTNH